MIESNAGEAIRGGRQQLKARETMEARETVKWSFKQRFLFGKRRNLCGLATLQPREVFSNPWVYKHSILEVMLMGTIVSVDCKVIQNPPVLHKCNKEFFELGNYRMYNGSSRWQYISLPRGLQKN